MGQQQLLLIILGVIIVGIAVAVGITMFQSNAVSSNRDAVISDMNMLASRCQAYYRKPVSMGGGGGTFTPAAPAPTLNSLFSPADLANDNGHYTVTPAAQSVTVVGMGKEVAGPGATDTVQVTMTVGPTTINVTINK